MKLVDISNRRFGRLLVLSYDGKSRWWCQCDCGVTKTIAGWALKSGDTQSCGCYHKEKFTHKSHGMSRTRTHNIWKGMRKRCNNKNSASYQNYGGRGIKICPRWNKFENFLADMGECPMGMSLDRINNGGNYEPKNCKWSTRVEQNNNRRPRRRGKKPKELE